MQVVHLGTKLTVLLGVLDDNGNVTNRTPVELGTEVFSREAILSLVEQVERIREEAETEMKKQVAGKPDLQVVESAQPTSPASTGG